MSRSRIKSSSLALAASQITSGVLAVARMVGTGLAGAPIRLNAGSSALAAAFPVVHLRDTAVALSAAVTTAVSASIPEAGTYLIEAEVRINLSGLTGTRTLDMTLSAANTSSIGLLPETSKTGGAPSHYGAITTNGGSAPSVSVAAADSRIMYRVAGRIVYTNASTCALRFVVSADSPTVEIGSWIRATRIG